MSVTSARVLKIRTLRYRWKALDAARAMALSLLRDPRVNFLWVDPRAAPAYSPAPSSTAPYHPPAAAAGCTGAPPSSSGSPGRQPVCTRSPPRICPCTCEMRAAVMPSRPRGGAASCSPRSAARPPRPFPRARLPRAPLGIAGAPPPPPRHASHPREARPRARRLTMCPSQGSGSLCSTRCGGFGCLLPCFVSRCRAPRS